MPRERVEITIGLLIYKMVHPQKIIRGPLQPRISSGSIPVEGSKAMKSILFVEDDLELARVLPMRLKQEGYQVTVVGSGMDAVRDARKTKPDLILLDIMLPEMDGYRVCSLLKRDDVNKNIPILVLSARTQPADIRKGMASGADGYITKPFKPEELLSKIKELLAKNAPMEA